MHWVWVMGLPSLLCFSEEVHSRFHLTNVTFVAIFSEYLFNDIFAYFGKGGL